MGVNCHYCLMLTLWWVQGEVFEMLLTLSDFDSFKDLMLAYNSVRCLRD